MEQHPHAGSPNQEPLIDAHSQSGEMVVRDFTLPESYVDFEQARIHRLNILSLFSAINQLEFVYAHRQQAVAERHGSGAEAVLANVEQKRGAMVREAEDRFYQSIGLYMVEATARQFPSFNIDQYRADARSQWMRFQAAYRSPNRRHRRNAYRDELLQQWTPEEVTQGQTAFNRHHDLRPHISKRDQEKAAKAGRTYPLLTTPERLVAIHEDPRAGFLPTTNLEKNMVMTYLDYLDNPEYPLGVTNQLFEVFIHQQKLDKPQPGDSPEVRDMKRRRSTERSGLHMARRSLESITYEMGDFMHNAQATLSALEGLQDFLKEGMNPRLAIAEEIPADNVGVRALARYHDLARYRDAFELPKKLQDPLRTKEHRWRKESDRLATDTGPNKTIEDLYTRGQMDESMQQYVAEWANGFTIREARKIINDAVEDQRRRLTFYQRQIGSIFTLAPDAEVLSIKQIAGELMGRTAA